MTAVSIIMLVTHTVVDACENRVAAARKRGVEEGTAGQGESIGFGIPRQPGRVEGLMFLQG